MLKKIGCFFGFCAYILGAAGGFGYVCYLHQYVIAGAIVALAVMAFPTFKKCVDELTSVEKKETKDS